MPAQVTSMHFKLESNQLTFTFQRSKGTASSYQVILFDDANGEELNRAVVPTNDSQEFYSITVNTTSSGKYAGKFI